MISPNAAWDMVRRHTKVLSIVRMPLNRADGFCLAENIRADRDMPPADRSAMDGYAVRSSDIAEPPARLKLVGEVAAGSAARPRISRNTCARILTGANVPPGADTVVMVEDTKEKDGIVTILRSRGRGANILSRGEDARKGMLLLEKGIVLNAARCGVCAAVGKARIKVIARPRIAIICVGEELREPDSRVRPYEMRNSNGPALCAAIRDWGYGTTSYRTLPDDIAILTAAIRHALNRCDVLIITGGMSVGKYDFVRTAIELIGAKIRFHGIAMKPGKPTLFATAPHNRNIFGLPGNPLSALTAFHEFVLPAIRHAAGIDAAHCRPSLFIPLASALRSKGGRIRYIQGRLIWTKAGPRLNAVASMSSADLVSAGKADGAIVAPEDARLLPAKRIVEFRPWRPLP
jgi:molybdopterin molybdotransferase